MELVKVNIFKALQYKVVVLRFYLYLYRSLFSLWEVHTTLEFLRSFIDHYEIYGLRTFSSL